MKNSIIRSIFALVLAFMALSMMGQNCMKVCFKDGSTRKYYLEKIIEITTSKVDEDGFSHSDYDYQHVKTTNGIYVFKLSDIECLTFTKISESQTAQSFASVSQVALDALSDCETVEDAEAKIEQIKSSSDVEDAWRDGASIYVKSKNGDIIPFHYSHSLEDTDAGSKMIMQAKAFLSRKKEVLKPINTRLKAAIVNQMHKDESRTEQITKYFYPLKDLFNSYGIETDYIDSLGIDFFYRTEPKPGEAPRPTMYDFDIVFLMTHGDYNESNNDHLLLLSTELGMERKSGKHRSEDLKKICEDKYFSYKENELGGLLNDMNCLSIGYNEEVRNGHKHFVGYVYLKELFFKEKAKDKFNKPISILFNGACLSLKNNHNLAGTLFKNQELDVYLGYDETNFLSEQTGYEWFISLLNGKSLNKSYEDLPEEHKTESGRLTNIPSWNYLNAHLEMGSRSGLDLQSLFLFPTVTKQIDQTTAQNAFNTSGYVEVEGNTTSYDPNEIFLGFEYSTNESMSSVSRVSATDVVKLSKFLDNGNGNVQFRGQITGLEPGKTYFYRAYTYDGMNYNYGELCSFTIEQPAQSACPARVVSVELVSTEYHRNANYPNQMYFTVSAALDDVSNVEEWGVYFDNRPGKKAFSFENVTRNQTIGLYYNGQEGLMNVNLNSYVVRLDDEVGVYVKRRNPSTGSLDTLYSDLFPFTLIYDTPPSLTLSNPVITSTQSTGYENGAYNYRTTISYDYDLKGAFWISYVNSGVSGGTWTFNSSNDDFWYPEKDGTGSSTWIATYSGNTEHMEHTNWRILHLRNGQTVNSNYVNFSGTETITQAWVTSTPRYAPSIKKTKGKGGLMKMAAGKSHNVVSHSVPEGMGRGTIFPTKDKREYPYKGGVIGAYK